jgi:hypothetical protein
MMLRDNPLISYKGNRSWPPVWAWIDGEEDKQPEGEVGILRTTLLSKIQPANRCYLLTSYEDSSYIGCLLFDDHAFCKHLSGVLRFCCNRSIAEIGSLDLTYTL